MTTIVNSNYLSHHGILGQKWGIRRYQNPDGSLTEDGKRRYVKSFEGVWYPNLYSVGKNKKDRRIANRARSRMAFKNISKEDWRKLYSGKKKDQYEVAEKLAKKNY